MIWMLVALLLQCATTLRLTIILVNQQYVACLVIICFFIIGLSGKLSLPVISVCCV